MQICSEVLNQVNRVDWIDWEGGAHPLRFLANLEKASKGDAFMTEEPAAWLIAAAVVDRCVRMREPVSSPLFT